MKKETHESSEDYLETILRLTNEMANVRSIDIARALNYSKPSVSRAMKILSDKGFIYMDENKFIHMTKEGLEKAKDVDRRHRILKAALVNLFDVSPEIAEKDACRIEHIVSEETILKIHAKVEEDRYRA